MVIESLKNETMKKLIESVGNLPIRARVVLATLVTFSAFLALLVFIAHHVLHDRMIEGIGVQQRAAAGLMATYVDENLEQRLAALQRLGSRVDVQKLSDTVALQAELRDHGPDERLFNSGVFVLNPDGVAIANVPDDVARVGVNYEDRDFFQRVMASGRPVIGQPVFGQVLQTPVLPIAVPVKDAAGNIIAVLAGIIDLSRPNFFDKLTHSRYGETGYFLLVDRSSHKIIASTDRSRILEDQSPRRSDPLVASHVAGEDATGLSVNPMGVEVLVSAASVSPANWFVAAALPVREAFAPIDAAESRILMMALVLGLLTILLTWLGIRRELKPLQSTLGRVAALMMPGTKLTPLPVERSNEIGQLVMGFNHLIEELADREQRLKESEFRWMFAIEGSGNGLWDWNMQNDTVYFSRQWKAMLGFAEHEIGDSLEEWKRRVHPDDLETTLTAIKKHIEGETDVYESEHRVICKSGEYLWVLDRGVIVNRDAQQRPLRMIGTHTDISKRKAMEEQVQQFAFHDPLTGLPNRRLLHDRFDQVMRASKRGGNYCGLMLLDLDNFKPLNDQHGHAAGDILLAEVAERLRKAVRETDTVARIGGDEFVVLLAQLGSSHESASRHALQIAEKIRLSLAAPYLIKLEGHRGRSVQHHCTASIGLVVFCAGAAGQEDLLRQADARMYAAKMSGRNRVVDVDAGTGEQVA